MSPKLRPAEPVRDFGQLAALFTSEQDEPTSESGLKEDYEMHKERIFRLMVAEDDQGELLGFNWATRSRSDASQAYCYVIVKPDQRRQGVGSQLYEDVEQAARSARVKQLEITIRDNFPEFQAFAVRRGFIEHSHSIAMELELDAFNDRAYDDLIARLKGEGFQFTSMDELGNTQEAQRKLYFLNDTTSAETPGSEGQHPWDSFEDFQKRVCQADWYKPAGQMVVLDAASGDFVAMSAITRFQGSDFAYNLHTGVDKRYRGRKLAQAVKVHALRFAREVLEVHSVHTHHNIKNLPMIAIDRKFGYVQTPGSFLMAKVLA
jgi:GNAT superfamily N-acetyltransferase